MTFTSFEFLVRGKVHGVGFRYFTREMARAEGIVGWVKNDPVSSEIVLIIRIVLDLTCSPRIRQGMSLEWPRVTKPLFRNCKRSSVNMLSAIISEAHTVS